MQVERVPEEAAVAKVPIPVLLELPHQSADGGAAGQMTTGRTTASQAGSAEPPCAPLTGTNLSGADLETSDEMQVASELCLVR